MSDRRDAAVALATRVAKLNEERRLVYGWASVAETDGRLLVDAAGDVIRPDTLIDAAHRFVRASRLAGVGHRTPAGEVVESAVLTRDVQRALGVDLGRVGWWIALKVADDEVWRQVRAGTLPALSIAGRAAVRPFA